MSAIERAFAAPAYDPHYQPSDTWEAAIWKRLPADGTRNAKPYFETVSLNGVPRVELMAALARLVGAGRARAWTEAPGCHLVARGAFRACNDCGAHTAPGACRQCGSSETRAPAEAAE